MLRCGLLGERLVHSYSPQIHSFLGDYEYKLYEKSKEEVVDFLKNGEWDALNVTIPYKKVAAECCDELSETAHILKSVNTIVKKDGRIYGDNTDYFGFCEMVKKSGIDVLGKKALVLGSGGTSVTACKALNDMGAHVTVISRSGENNYNNLERYSDAMVIVNTTPVGMYPNNGSACVDLKLFPECEGVLDVIYNPLRTALLLQAEDLKIKNLNGLYMLCAQAKKSAEIFTGSIIDDSRTDYIFNKLSCEMGNIILIGMPGCGKSAIAKELGKLLNREVIELDDKIAESAKKSIPKIFEDVGEQGFRRLETEQTAIYSKLSGKVISTGGGCVTVPENYGLLHQNGVIVWIKRDISKLPKDSRPISLKSDLNELYNRRKPYYERFADFSIENDTTIEKTALKIVQKLKA